MHGFSHSYIEVNMENKELAITFENNYNQFFTAAFRVTGNIEDTEDVIQNSMIKAMKHIGSFRVESSLSTWLYRIVVNEALSFSKYRKKLPVTEFAEHNQLTEKQVYDHINSFGMSDDGIINEKTRESCLQMFMNCMPDSLRVVYTLRVILEFSTSSTADILNISPNNVKTRLCRARKIINSHFRGRCSLIKEGEMCNCRSYAKFLVIHNKADKLIRVDIMRNKEKMAAIKFEADMHRLNQIDRLYNSTLCIDKNIEFKNKIIAVLNQGDISILKKDPIAR